MRVHGTSAVVVSVVCVVVCLLSQCAVEARMLHDDKPTHDGPNALSPNYCIFEHNIGKFVMAINNNGTFGVNYAQTANIDCFTQLEVQSCEYPKGARTVYMYGAAFWIGAIAGRDTLVTVGADGWQQMYEMLPDEGALGQVLYRSTIASDQSEREGAVSEQDFIARYTDTCTSRCSGTGFSQFDQRSHLPIGIEVTQRSYAWSYAYAEDIILFDYTIRNITNQRLQDVYMGIYVDADVCDLALLEEEEGFADDICGFRQKAPAAYLPSYCDPDSGYRQPGLDSRQRRRLRHAIHRRAEYHRCPDCPHAPRIRLRFLSTGGSATNYPPRTSGPQARASYRNLGTGGTGTPEGDANKYHFLSNREFDYDQIKTSSIAAGDSIWLSPPAGISDSVTDGYDTRYLLSFGPFDIDPGESLPLSFAYIAGEGFHIDPNNGDNLRTGDWERYYEGVSFADLDANSTWADWIYDNPGYDTDSDSYMGEYTVCNLGDDSTLAYDTTVDSNVTPWDTTVDTYWAYDVADTILAQGRRGCRTSGAPLPRRLRLPLYLADQRQVRLEGRARCRRRPRDLERRGVRECSRRVLARIRLRRLPCPSGPRLTAHQLLGPDVLRQGRLQQVGMGLRHPGLRPPSKVPTRWRNCRRLYSSGDTTWHPLDYPRSRPFVNPSDPDEIFFFTPQDFNRSVLANDQVNATTEIRKSLSRRCQAADGLPGLAAGLAVQRVCHRRWVPEVLRVRTRHREPPAHRTVVDQRHRIRLRFAPIGPVGTGDKPDRSANRHLRPGIDREGCSAKVWRSLCIRIRTASMPIIGIEDSRGALRSAAMSACGRYTSPIYRRSATSGYSRSTAT